MGATLSDSNPKEVWENRRCSFGLLLHITGIKQSQPYEALKQVVSVGGYTCSWFFSLPTNNKYASQTDTTSAEKVPVKMWIFVC